MKKISVVMLLFVFALGFAANAQSQAKTVSPVDKVIKMSKAQYDIGKQKHNEPTTFFMEFTNISNKPVVVENVMVSCGCTVAEKPVAPILPGKTGKVKVGYNNASIGKFNKDVNIKINGISEPKIIYFVGETTE